VAEHVTHLGERRTLADQIGRQAMAQDMGSHILARRLDAGSGERVLQDGVEDRPVLERAVRRPDGDEQRARCRDTIPPHVVSQCFADIGRDRHAIVVLTFPTHDKFAGAPVDIAELDGDHFRRAQAEARKEDDHRIVAAA